MAADFGAAVKAAMGEPLMKMHQTQPTPSPGSGE